MTTPRTTGARAKAHPTESKILCDEHSTTYFPRASRNIAAATAKMRVMAPQATPEGQRIMGDLHVLLEAAACQHADSFEDKRRPGASNLRAPSVRAATSIRRRGGPEPERARAEDACHLTGQPRQPAAGVRARP